MLFHACCRGGSRICWKGGPVRLWLCLSPRTGGGSGRGCPPPGVRKNFGGCLKWRVLVTYGYSFHVNFTFTSISFQWPQIWINFGMLHFFLFSLVGNFETTQAGFKAGIMTMLQHAFHPHPHASLSLSLSLSKVNTVPHPTHPIWLRICLVNAGSSGLPKYIESHLVISTDPQNGWVTSVFVLLSRSTQSFIIGRTLGAKRTTPSTAVRYRASCLLDIYMYTLHCRYIRNCHERPPLLPNMDFSRHMHFTPYMLQWSLQFKTLLFDNHLNFKINNQWHNSNIF